MSDTLPYPLDPQRALPTAAYRDPTIHEVELDRIWHGDWVFVGTADQVAEPGDHFATVVGRQPVIVLRNQAGQLAALSNLCAHRGTLLVDEPGNTKRFQCPYHAWTFRDDGSLLSVPYAPGDAIDKDAHCLPRYAVESWHGLIFVSLNPSVGSLAERFAHLDDLATEHRLAELHHWTGERTTEEWHANWKLILSNAAESYHLFKVHPETLEPYAPTADAYSIVGTPDASATGGKQPKRDDYVLFRLGPNIVGTFFGGDFGWQAAMPLAVDRSLVTVGLASKHKSPSATNGIERLMNKAASSISNMVIPDFLPEDKTICERGQRGASGDFQPGRLVPMEQVLVDFHEYLVDRLGTDPSRTRPQ